MELSIVNMALPICDTFKTSCLNASIPIIQILTTHPPLILSLVHQDLVIFLTIKLVSSQIVFDDQNFYLTIININKQLKFELSKY